MGLKRTEEWDKVEMVDCHEQDISFRSKDFADRLAQAHTLVNDGDFCSAHAVGVALKKVAPTRPEPVLLLARILQLRDGPAKKAAFLSDCLAQGLDHARVKRELAQALLVTGTFLQARALAKQTIANGKANLSDYMTVARSYFLENKFQRALEYVEKARQLEPSRPEPVLLMARIVQRRDGPVQKAALLSDCLAQGMTDIRLKRELSQTLLRTGEFEQARTLAKQTITAGNANFLDHMTIARSFLHGNDLQDALNFAEEALRLAPTRVEPVLLVARILQLQSGPARKAAFLSDIIAQGMNDFKLKRELAILQINIGNIERAIEVAKGIDLNECDDPQLLMLFEIFEMCHCKVEANICLRQIDPNSSMGNAALLSDFLNKQIDAKTTLRLQSARNLPNDKFGQAIQGLCEAANGEGTLAISEALSERMSDIILGCKGAESYFVIENAAGEYQTPLVSIVAPIHRTEDQNNLLSQLLRQDYPNLEVIIVINGPNIDGAAFEESLGQHENYKRVHIKNWPEKTPLPKVLNVGFAAARGEYIARFDADDLYLDKYISRSINFMQKMSADICGKQQLFQYLEALGCVCFRGDRYVPIAHINKMSGSGSTLIISRKVMETIQFNERLLGGEDRDFYNRSWCHGFRITFSPPFDHIVIRKADKTGHTWKLVDLRFLMQSENGGFLSCCSKDKFEAILVDMAN